MNSNLISEFIPGSENKVSDKLSRLDLGDFYQFNVDIFSYIFDIIGPFSIDRFATKNNTLLDLFNSYFYEFNTAGIDAFA